MGTIFRSMCGIMGTILRNTRNYGYLSKERLGRNVQSELITDNLHDDILGLEKCSLPCGIMGQVVIMLAELWATF